MGKSVLHHEVIECAECPFCHRRTGETYFCFAAADFNPYKFIELLYKENVMGTIIPETCPLKKFKSIEIKLKNG